MNILHKPPSFPSTPDFHLCFSSSLPGYSSVHSSFFPFSRSLRHAVRPAIFQLLHLLPLFSVSQSQQSAESGLYSCSHNLSTFPSLSLPLCPSICQLFLTVFQSLTPLNASVFLHQLHLLSIHPRRFFSSCTPSPDLPSILSRASDEARE